MSRARILEISSYPPPRAGWGIRVEYLKKHLEAAGHECTSRWLDGGTFENNHTNAAIDIVDVLRADAILNFTDPAVEHSPHPYAARGGRHVEFGLAMGIGMHLLIVGPRENVFHHHDSVIVCETWEAALEWLTEVGDALEDAAEAVIE